MCGFLQLGNYFERVYHSGMNEKNPNVAFLSLFPSISRFITERVPKTSSMHFTKVLLVSFVSGMILIGISLQGALLQRNVQAMDMLAGQREQMVKEIGYWEQFANKHGAYRDVYLRLAALHYRVGNVDIAKGFLQKAVELDPNSEAGKVLGAKITAGN